MCIIAFLNAGYIFDRERNFCEIVFVAKFIFLKRMKKLARSKNAKFTRACFSSIGNGIKNWSN